MAQKLRPRPFDARQIVRNIAAFPTKPGQRDLSINPVRGGTMIFLIRESAFGSPCASRKAASLISNPPFSELCFSASVVLANASVSPQ